MRKIVYCLLFIVYCFAACTETVSDAKQETAQPSIYPDYIGVTIPVNIAPLNFSMADDEALLVDAVITNRQGHTLHSQGDDAVDFDLDDWHALLADTRGDSLTVTVSAKYDDGWHTYRPFALYVSPDSIDYGLCYRLIEPGYEVWSKMGIYERDLSSFDESALIENTQFEGCINCHSFNRGNPADMSLHIRGPHGATLLRHDNSPFTAYNTKTPQTLGLCVYPYWHPSGRYIAYSTNTTRQLFHSADRNRIEVFDEASDIQVYDVEKNELILSTLVKQDSVYETFPVFSADGRSLYFCAARALPQVDQSEQSAKSAVLLDSIRYNLCRIDFDPATGTFGDHIDTIIDAASQGKSISFPRPSYDGRFLCYTLSDYGQFSIWHHEADLWLLDLNKAAASPMTGANSDDTESFHNWSSNSRWLVLSSRRDDGLFTRPYFCHIDTDGRVSKAFMLPQRHPRQFYRDRFFSFNVPEFIISPTRFDGRQAARIINSPSRKDFSVR
ncbi:MAG: PD40 domain-containing protein [Prevotella sp.]|nr:PD40 domain-containing protein [Prevotella sp.]